MSKEATLVKLGTAVIAAVEDLDCEFDVHAALTELTLRPDPDNPGSYVISITTTDDVDAEHVKDQISERTIKTR